MKIDKKRKKLFKEIIYTDLADEFLVVKLECRVKDCFDWLEHIKERLDDEGYFQDYVENVAIIRSCLILLNWYTGDDYGEWHRKVNKYSLKLEEVY